jgi:uncharacterized Ntn-hydrolase superfamily protein
MTFSIAAHCPDTGMFGVAVCSSSICVASRCAFVRTKTGAALSQNVTDPRLGPRMLDLAAQGLTAKDCIDQVVAETEHIDYRQLGLIDSRGGTGQFSGARCLGRVAAARGNSCVAMGNLLANESIPDAMIKALESRSGHLGYRLVMALRAGLDAGGEEGPVYSAGVLVAAQVPWPVVDLRVDWDAAPIEKLQLIWQEYETQIESYVIRALHPELAPAYGVPGDEK